MTKTIQFLACDLGANFEAMQAVTKEKLVTGPRAGHPNVIGIFLPQGGP
jgi:hypothetical protein